jgi:hypothetical protein
METALPHAARQTLAIRCEARGVGACGYGYVILDAFRAQNKITVHKTTTNNNNTSDKQAKKYTNCNKVIAWCELLNSHMVTCVGLHGYVTTCFMAIWLGGDALHDYWY